MFVEVLCAIQEVKRGQLLHVDVCDRDFDFIKLFGPVAGQLLSLRTEAFDFNEDLANILQACGQLKQLSVPNLSLLPLFDGSWPRPLPFLPMVEKLCVCSVQDEDASDLDILASLPNTEDPLTLVKERLPRLQVVQVQEGMHREVLQSLLDDVCIAIIHIESDVCIQRNSYRASPSCSWISDEIDIL